MSIKGVLITGTVTAYLLVNTILPFNSMAHMMETEANNQGTIGKYLVGATVYRRAWESLIEGEYKTPKEHVESPYQYAIDYNHKITGEDILEDALIMTLAPILAPIWPWDSFYNPQGTSFRHPGYTNNHVGWNSGVWIKFRDHLFWNQFK
ncbi:MAG: hypothetical protein HGA85_09405 [Nanoarchaeota archaeon]|nr:hypothetical protein [Nanoarchaeota archaeon]